MARNTEHLHVLMDSDTRRLLDWLAAQDAVSAAEVVRRLIQRSAKAKQSKAQ